MASGLSDGDHVIDLWTQHMLGAWSDRFNLTWDMQKTGQTSYQFNTGSPSDNARSLTAYDAFPTTGLTVSGTTSGAGTAIFNGTEFLLPESGTSTAVFSSFTTLAGTFADIRLSVAVNTSEEVAMFAIDTAATPDSLDFFVRAADETQVTAETTIATHASNIQDPKAIGIAANYWVTYTEAGTNNVYLTVVDNAGAVQFSLTQDEVNTNINTSAATSNFTAPANNGTRAFVFGTSSDETDIYYAAYAISDGNKDLSSRDLGRSGTIDHKQIEAVGDPDNVLIYLVSHQQTATSSEELGLMIYVLNNDGDVIRSNLIPQTENAALMEIAISNDRTRLAIVTQFDGGVSTGDRILMIDTTTLKVVGSSIPAVGATNSPMFPKMGFGPGDRLWIVGNRDSDIYYAIINKDGTIHRVATQIAAETVTSEVIIWNPDNINNKIWNVVRDGNADIQFRTYDFLWSDAGSAVAQSEGFSLPNTVSQGATAVWDEALSGTTISYETSTDRGVTFTSGAINSLFKYATAGSTFAVRAILSTGSDFISPKWKAWGFAGIAR